MPHVADKKSERKKQHSESSDLFASIDKDKVPRHNTKNNISNTSFIFLNM